MQPQRDQDPYDVPYAKPPKPGGPSGQSVLLWLILAVLVANLVLTVYVFGVVHQVVSDAHSVSSLFGG